VKRFLSYVLALVVLAGICFAAMEMQPALADDAESVPYVGMPESSIDYTSIGRPFKSEFQRSIWRTRKDATVYTWMKYGITYFTARVEEGRVVAVKDNRDWLEAAQKRQTKQSKQTSRPAVYHDEPEEDPYEASGYANAEDFYDDYYDDFFDYEEAEEYWEDHQEEDW